MSFAAFPSCGKEVNLISSILLRHLVSFTRIATDESIWVSQGNKVVFKMFEILTFYPKYVGMVDKITLQSL
jgi:hypothetical protein